MTRNLILLIVMFFIARKSYAQYDVGTDTTAIGVGATSSSSNYKFIYQGNSVPHFGLGWYSDAGYVGAPMAYLGGYGGVKLFTNGTARLTVTHDGNVGIGTTTPVAKLDVNGNGNFNGTVISTSDMISTNGTVKAFLSVSNSYTTGVVGTQSNHDLAFYTNSLPVARFTTDGDFGIGTSTPDAKLAVNGTIHSKEVKVDLVGWPDYVFKPTYSLASLKDVKIYIDQNHHLPDMPSEQQVAKDGINLGEIVKLQTKKIEELTLYLIQQKEEMDKQINELKSQLAKVTK